MSTAAKEKKPFLPQRKAPAQPSGGTVAIRGAAAPGRGSAGYVALSIGGEPRVHLLPPEVSARRKDKELKRRVLFGGGVVVALVVLGYGLATVGLASVQSQLAAVQATNISLLAQQSKYGAVTKVNSDIAAIQQSQLTATSQEILWAPYLLTLENTLPAGASINAIQALTDAPLGTPPITGGASSVPLQGPRIATVQATLVINQADIPGWLDKLPTLKGFVDATPNSVTAIGGVANQYTLIVTIHMNSDAVSNRFVKAAGETK